MCVKENNINIDDKIITKRRCTKCGELKFLTDFNVCSRVKIGRRSVCRICQSIESKIYKSNHKNQIKEYNKEWNSQNKQYYKDYHHEYYKKNIDYINKRRKKWFESNPNYCNEYQKNRKKKDKLFHLQSRMRYSVNRYLKQKSMNTFDIVGCSPGDLKCHLEKQFTNGMTWENYGQFGWHIDHIIPLSSAKNEDELYRLCHYTNLQPLWWRDNILKGSKILTKINKNDDSTC